MHSFYYSSTLEEGGGKIKCDSSDKCPKNKNDNIVYYVSYRRER